MLPALSVQPIVENAIKYGIGMREDGGAISISTKRHGGGIDVTIRDDGMGYDPAEVQLDGRTHIGIENVRERLKRYAAGRSPSPASRARAPRRSSTSPAA